jgi:maleylacetate reductase
MVPALGLRGPGLVVGSVRSVELIDRAGLPEGTATSAVSESHNPTAALRSARSAAEQSHPHWLLAIGSASAIDLAKAVAEDQPGLAITAVPTTLGGSEMSRFYGTRGDDGVKGGGSGGALLPSTVLYDPDLLATLETGDLVATGLNALAHGIEALYARTVHWMGSAAASEVVGTLPDLLLTLDSDRSEDRHQRLFRQAALAGFAMNTNGMGLHHAICHVLGGITGIRHAYLNSVVLPHAVNANVAADPGVGELLSSAGLADPVTTLATLRDHTGLPASLAELGMSPADVETALPRVMSAHHMKNNPAVLTEEQVHACLNQALSG